jgi:hypothetical protein
MVRWAVPSAQVIATMEKAEAAPDRVAATTGSPAEPRSPRGRAGMRIDEITGLTGVPTPLAGRVA